MSQSRDFFLRLILGVAAALAVAVAFNSASAKDIKNTSAKDIGDGFHHQDHLERLYYEGGPLNTGATLGFSEKVHAIAVLNQLVVSCPNFMEGILMTPPLVFLIGAVPGEDSAPFAQESGADLRTMVSRYGCASATMSRVFNNSLSMFIGVEPVTNQSATLPAWGLKKR